MLNKGLQILRSVIRGILKLNGKTSGMDSPYRETKKGITTWVRKCMATELLEHVFTECTPTRPDYRNELSDLLVTLLQSDNPNPVTLNTPVTPAGTLGGIQAHIKFIWNLITCITIVPDVSKFIPAIRMCRCEMSKNTLGQLCNHTFPDPCCHNLFFVTEESIPEVLPLSFDTPCILNYRYEYSSQSMLRPYYEVLFTSIGKTGVTP
jgi:hypothetical protein